jgi:hypothetical protein
MTESESYEYKVLPLEYTGGSWTGRRAPDIQKALNSVARDGWRLRQILTPAIGFGSTKNFILALERPCRA